MHLGGGVRDTPSPGVKPGIRPRLGVCPSLPDPRAGPTLTLFTLSGRETDNGREGGEGWMEERFACACCLDWRHLTCCNAHVRDGLVRRSTSPASVRRLRGTCMLCVLR